MKTQSIAREWAYPIIVLLLALAVALSAPCQAPQSTNGTRTGQTTTIDVSHASIVPDSVFITGAGGKTAYL